MKGNGNKNMQFGERLAYIRKKNGYTQQQLAEKLNVSQQVVSNIERNASAPDIDFIRGVADLYNVSIDELIGRTVNPSDKITVERQIMNVIERMDDMGKELSLDLVNQVAKHQGGNND